MRRQRVVLAAESAEIDDPLDARLSCGLAERSGGLRVQPFEVLGVQRVHQVVSRPTTVESTGQRGGVVHVPVHGVAIAVVTVRVSGHCPHLMASRRERWTETPPDEAGGSGDQNRSWPDHRGPSTWRWADARLGWDR
jgi:hypothetical protein